MLINQLNNTAEARRIDIAGKNVLIIGAPASGKTYLSGIFSHAGHQVIHTDDYMEFGFQEALYRCLDDICDATQPTLVEGVQGPRLLRKGVEMDCYYPDIVFELVTSWECIERTYNNERDAAKLKGQKGFQKMNETILNDYFSMLNTKKPVWYRVQNQY